MREEFWTAKRVAIAGALVAALFSMPANGLAGLFGEGLGQVLGAAFVGALIGGALGCFLPSEQAARRERQGPGPSGQ